MDMKQLYDRTLTCMETSHTILAGRVQAPRVVRLGKNGLSFRYAEKGIHEALIQKLARVVSGLHAVLLLAEHGFCQEQAALQRMIDELNEDILVLAHGVVFNKPTDLHQEYLAAFYKEEFDNPDSAIKSTQRRPMVPRQKIRAYISRIEGLQLDVNATVEALRTVQKAYSGYVHGASPHIMEMYLGRPPRWHLRGMLGTHRVDDHRSDLRNVFYRGIVLFAYTAKAFGDEELFGEILRYTREFAAAAGVSFAHPPAGTDAQSET